jgi:hypothetical protein
MQYIVFNTIGRLPTLDGIKPKKSIYYWNLHIIEEIKRKTKIK